MFRLVSGVSSYGHETGVAKIQEQVLIMIDDDGAQSHCVSTVWFLPILHINNCFHIDHQRAETCKHIDVEDIEDIDYHGKQKCKNIFSL